MGHRTSSLFALTSTDFELKLKKRGENGQSLTLFEGGEGPLCKTLAKLKKENACPHHKDSTSPKRG